MFSITENLNHAKSFASDVVYPKWVQPNLEKISFVFGYVWMNINQLVCGKKHLSVPSVIQKNIVQGTHEHLDQFLGIPTTQSDCIDLIDDVSSTVLKGFSSSFNEKVAKELVFKYGFPVEILEERFKDFCGFIIDSQIYAAINYYKHSVVYNNGDLFLLVQGEPISSQEVIKNYRLEKRVLIEKMFLPPFILDKTGKRYSYLEKGLTLHDVEKEIRPYKTLPEGERPLNPLLIFKFAIDGAIESPEDLANFRHHCWFDLNLPTGSCYSFGLYGKGVVQCPDPGAFVGQEEVRSISFEITNDQIIDVFKKVKQLRNDIAGKYHIAKYNCSSVLKEIAAVVGIDILEKNKMKDFDGIILRIKMYAISSLLANALRDIHVSSKIVLVQEFIGLSEYIGNLGVNPCSKVLSLLDEYPTLKDALVKTFRFFEKNMLEKIVIISPKEMKELCSSMLTGSERELTYKLYNFFESIFLNYYEHEVDAPGFVYNRLLAIKYSIKPKACITLI